MRPNESWCPCFSRTQRFIVANALNVQAHALNNANLKRISNRWSVVPSTTLMQMSWRDRCEITSSVKRASCTFFGLSRAGACDFGPRHLIIYLKKNCVLHVLSHPFETPTFPPRPSIKNVPAICQSLFKCQAFPDGFTYAQIQNSL